MGTSDTNAQRRLAVQLRQQGVKLAEAARQSGLSMPTVVAAFKAWQQGGWDAVDTRPRGRKPAGTQALSAEEEAQWIDRWRRPGEGLWSLARCAEEIRAAHPRAAKLAPTQLEPMVQRLWHRADLAAPIPWDRWRARADADMVDWQQAELHSLRQLAREANATLLALGERTLSRSASAQLTAHTGRGTVQWLITASWPTETDWITFLSALRQQHLSGPLWLLTDNRWLNRRPSLARWLADASPGVQLMHPPQEQSAPPEPPVFASP